MAKTVKELSALVEELVAKCNELEQRSYNFASRVTALNRASRDEIKALRDEVAGLKAQRMNTRVEPRPPALPRISAQAWSEAYAKLKARPGETRSFFPPAEVRGMALHLATDVRADAQELSYEEVEL